MSSAMGWKKWFGAVVGAMIALSTAVFPTEIGALIDSIVPNAGFYIVRISFLAIAVYLVVLLVDGIYRRWFKNFEAEIIGKGPFLLGGTIGFKASYKGKLEKGFFTCKIVPPSGEVLPTEAKTYEYWPCYGTFQHVENRDVGILKGSKDYEYAWEAKIPKNYPEGEYMALIGVYESDSLVDDWVKNRRLPFLVMDSKNVSRGSTGVTAILNGEVHRKIIDDSRSV